MCLIKDTFIVVVTYNSTDFIVNCLDSIVKSNYHKWFLAVVDNSSSDDTLQKIDGFCKQGQKVKSPDIPGIQADKTGSSLSSGLNSSNFKLISLKKNIGFAPAVNYCVFNYLFKQDGALADNIKFLVLINPDLKIKEDTLTGLLNTLGPQDGKTNTCGAAGGIIYDYEEDNIQNAGGMIRDNYITWHLDRIPVKNGQGYVESVQGQEIYKTEPYEADYVTGALLATRMKHFITLGGLDSGYRPLYFEELDFCLKLRRLGLAPVINPEVWAAHFEGASVKKFSGSFYRHYHKNRLRCAVINCGFRDFFTKFIPAEIKWLKNGATDDQKKPICKAYFLNFVFFLYNLTVRLKNALKISKYLKTL